MFSLLLQSLIVISNLSEASQRIKASEEHTHGSSFQSTVSMSVEKPSSTRHVKFKLWASGRTKTLIKVLEPAKDRQSGNLRIDLNLWQFLPKVDRIVKIPPSMMLQNWMGSQFTNDDLLRVSSLFDDYTHEIVGREEIDGYRAVKIICTPKPQAPIVWGKVIEWVRESDNVPLRREMFTEGGKRVKWMVGSEIKSFGKHTIPTVLTMKEEKNSDHQTILRYDDVVFDQHIAPSLFSQEALRRSVAEKN